MATNGSGEGRWLEPRPRFAPLSDRFAIRVPSRREVTTLPPRASNFVLAMRQHPSFATTTNQKPVARMERSGNPATTRKLECPSRMALRFSGYANKREAKRRQARNPTVRTIADEFARSAQTVCRVRRASCGMRRLSAFHRGSRLGEPTPLLSFGDALPGTRHVPVPVQRAPRRLVLMPAGRSADAAPARTANPRGSTALAPLSKVPSRRRPLSDRDYAE